MTIKDGAEYGRDNLNLSTVTSTLWHWLQIVDIKEEAYEEMRAKTREKLSKKVSVDEVYDNGDAILIVTDPVKDLILLAHLYERKLTNADIVSDFTVLKEKGIEIECCTRDASCLYQNTLQQVFGNIALQLCIFHFIKKANKQFLNWHKKIRQELKEKSLPRGLQGAGTRIKKYLFQKRCLFVKEKLNLKEKQILSNINQAIPAFGRLRELYLRFKHIFKAENVSQAENRLWDFIAEPDINEFLPKLQKQILKYHQKNELFTYLHYNKEIWTKIRTSNHTERVNRKFRKKQKTHYRLRKIKSRKKLLRCMLYFHNAKSLKLNYQQQLIVNPNHNYLPLLLFRQL